MKSQIGKVFEHRTARHIPLLQKIITEKGFKTMIEVGTYLGETACGLAPYLEYLITVDNFSARYSGNLQQHFRYNTQDIYNIIPITGDSYDVGKQLTNLGLSVDIAYIDADHSYIGVKKDIETYYYLAKFICGDNYAPYYHGVIAAVDEFAEKNNLKVEVIDKDFWYYVAD